jgi:O-antigen/teichoic acid export membrane protein
MANFLKARQGAGAGSAYVAGSFFISGLLTYVFQGLSARYLGKAGYGDLILLWSMTFLLVQVLWIGVTQTLGRFVSERLSRGEDPRPVVSSVSRLQLALLGVFVAVYLLASPLGGGRSRLRSLLPWPRTRRSTSDAARSTGTGRPCASACCTS